MRSLTLAAAPLLVLACASASPDAPAASTSSSASAPDPAALPDLLAGRYAFSLDESDAARTIRERCANESSGDAAKAAQCYAAIRVQAASEGIAFEKDAQGGVRWVSFGEEGGVPTVFHSVPVALASAAAGSGPVTVTARTLSAATGTLASNRPIPEGITMRIEIVDERTIAMHDPNPPALGKGRLVFHRVAAR